MKKSSKDLSRHELANPDTLTTNDTDTTSRRRTYQKREYHETEQLGIERATVEVTLDDRASDWVE